MSLDAILIGSEVIGVAFAVSAGLNLANTFRNIRNNYKRRKAKKRANEIMDKQQRAVNLLKAQKDILNDLFLAKMGLYLADGLPNYDNYKFTMVPLRPPCYLNLRMLLLDSNSNVVRAIDLAPKSQGTITSKGEESGLSVIKPIESNFLEWNRTVSDLHRIILENAVDRDKGLILCYGGNHMGLADRMYSGIVLYIHAFAKFHKAEIFSDPDLDM